jgi:tetratricopeptide (TPR) repeat protein
LDQAASNDAADARELARQFMVRYPATALGADGLIFLAARQLAHGDTNGAMASYAIIKDELPTCALCGEAETRLAEHALRIGRLDDASALLDSAEAHVQDMPTALEISLLRAHLLRAGGRINDAIRLYEDILANRTARGPMWPKALYGLASAYAELGDHRRAIPYYQRIYVMYAGYTGLTAKAYYYSGRCFERLHDMAAAVNSYRALLADERLRGCPEATLARERLEHLPVPAAPAAQTKESGV